MFGCSDKVSLWNPAFYSKKLSVLEICQSRPIDQTLLAVL